MLYSEIMALSCGNHTKYVCTLYGQNAEILILNLAVCTQATGPERVLSSPIFQYTQQWHVDIKRKAINKLCNQKLVTDVI
jgi:hypothetical protein